MSEASAPTPDDQVVPDDVLPRGDLPAMEYRDLPDPVPVRKMIGPSVILAGLALGSGEFVLWPYITYMSGFVFFWACIIGVTMQYFMNMEVTRWTLATGESAITGFCRLNRHWAWAFLVLNIVPWMIPAWATGAAEMINWLLYNGESRYVREFSIAGLFLCGLILTAGPVLYETVERVQIVLVTGIVLVVIVLAILVFRPDAVAAQVQGTISFQVPSTDVLGPAMLLGALAFAGAGGTTNLGQSNYVKDKGYGMGKYIGRITSPITGQAEAVVEIGYHFPDTPENRSRWKRWWRAASVEHFFSFFLTCLVCLVLLTLITYSVFYDTAGELKENAAGYERTGFILGEADWIGQEFGTAVRVLFLLMGVAIMLTTEFGILDVSTRISTDIVKVNWLRENPRWSEGRLYYLFLWGNILLGTVLLLFYFDEEKGALPQFRLTAAMNGGVMFLYSMTLLYLNNRTLPKPIRMSWPRIVVMAGAVLFFGFFTIWALWTNVF